MTDEPKYEDGWRPIETAPKTQDDILVCGWHYEFGEYGEVLSRVRYICISSMLDDAYGRRCVGHRNGPKHVTHYRPMPDFPEDDKSDIVTRTYLR